MAEHETRASEAQARESRSTAREAAARRGSEPPAENRVFDAGAEMARHATEAGAQTARDLTRASAETGRRMAETGSRAMNRGADLWRESLFPLSAFSDRMNHLVTEFWRTALPGMAIPSLSPLGSPGGKMMQTLGVPCADLHETPDSYYISVELAGIQPQDVEVMVEDDSLLIRGEKRDVHREEQGGFRVNERRFGRFERRFQLPRDANREGIEADFHDGLLEIRLVRRPEHEHGRRRIEVRHNGAGRARRDERSGGPETGGRAGQRGETGQARP
jgi:HSP20 family molecular chaperone IbpA